MPLRHSLLLLAIALTLVARLRGEAPPANARDADRERIARLIQQLGDDNFAQRKSATDALRKIGSSALPELRQAASNGKDSEIRERAANLVSHIENSLKQLLADYRSYGLPLPPDKAPLVQFNLKASTWASSAIALGFVIKPAAKKGASTILHGSELIDVDAAPARTFPSLALTAPREPQVWQLSRKRRRFPKGGR